MLSTAPDHRWRNWSSYEDRTLRREVSLEQSLEAIAARHARTKKAIRSRMEKLGLASGE